MLKSKLLLFVLLLLPYFLGKLGLIIIVILFLLIFLTESSIKIKFKKLVFLIFSPIIFASIYGLLKYNIYEVFKDVFYFISPCIYFFAGLYFAEKLPQSVFLKVVVVLGTLLSVKYIYIVLTQVGFSAFIDPRNSRYLVMESTYIISVLALIILIYLYISKTYIGNYSKFMLNMCIVINLCSLYFSGSRTNTVCFLIMFLSLMYVRFRKYLFTFFILFCLLIVGFAFIILDNPNTEMAKSILTAQDELVIKDVSDAKERNSAYRGWEAYRTIETYNKGNNYELIMGHGLGKMIDLGMFIELGGSDYRYIPIVHNGYMFILVKTGAFGLLVYFIFFIMVIKGIPNNSFVDLSLNVRYIACLSIGILVSLYIANMVITGLFNPSYTCLLLSLGFFVQKLNIYEQTKITENTKHLKK